MSSESDDSSTNKKKGRVVGPEGRRMIASVYRFLKNEYEFTAQFQEPNCDLSHLKNIAERTAEATGVSSNTVYRVLKEERHSEQTSLTYEPPKKKPRKKKENTEETIDADEEDQSSFITMESTSSGVTSPTKSKDTTDKHEDKINNYVKKEIDGVLVKKEVDIDDELHHEIDIKEEVE